MAAAGHEVNVFTTSVSPGGETMNELPAFENYLGINIYRFRNLTAPQLTLGFYPGLLWKLIRTKTDIIHVENGPGFIWQETCLIIKKLVSPKTKLVTTPHGPFLATPQTHNFAKRTIAQIGKFLLSPYYKLIWSKLFAIVFEVNPKQEVWMTRDYNIPQSKIKLMPNGIEAAQIANSKTVASKFNAANDNDEVVITSVGRLGKYKGHHYIIQALADGIETARFVNPPRLIIMGKDEGYAAELQHLIEFYNLQDIAEVKVSPSDSERDEIIYNQSQISILASDWEATGIVLLEAMAAGNSIVTSSGNEAADMLIKPGENGYIFTAGHVAELLEYLAHLINDNKLRSEMAQRNLNLVTQFTWESIFPKYLKYLQELISK